VQQQQQLLSLLFAVAFSERLATPLMQGYTKHRTSFTTAWTTSTVCEKQQMRSALRKSSRYSCSISKTWML
jgi:hypothetical protein